MTRRFLVFVTILGLALVVQSAWNTASAQAQNSVPEMPDPIRNLEAEGAQIRYMGRDHGFDSWLSVKNGQEQYFYVPPNGTGFVMGVLFDNSGRVVTIDQIQRMRDKGDTLLDSLSGVDDLQSINETKKDSLAFKSPAERLFHDTEQSNWVPLGFAGAPVIYAIIDPNCPHCHAMIDDIRKAGYLDRGELQMRIIPVGFLKNSKEEAAFLLASPNPQERLFEHMDGDGEAYQCVKALILRA